MTEEEQQKLQAQRRAILFGGENFAVHYLKGEEVTSETVFVRAIPMRDLSQFAEYAPFEIKEAAFYTVRTGEDGKKSTATTEFIESLAPEDVIEILRIGRGFNAEVFRKWCVTQKERAIMLGVDLAARTRQPDAPSDSKNSSGS